MQAILVKMVFKLVIKAINKKYNMKSIDNYVHNDNELDKRVRILEKEAHPPVFSKKQHQNLLKRVKALESAGKGDYGDCGCKGACIQ
jgi:hypothetical protein